MKIEVLEQNDREHLGPLGRMPRGLIEALSGTKHDTLKPLPTGEYIVDQDIGEIITFAVALRALWVDRLVEKSAEKSVKVIEKEMSDNGIADSFEDLSATINLRMRELKHHGNRLDEQATKTLELSRDVERFTNEKNGLRHWAQEKFTSLTDRLDGIECQVVNLDDEGLGDPLIQQFATLKADYEILFELVEDHPITGHRVEIEALKDRINPIQQQLEDLSLKMQANHEEVTAKVTAFEPLDERIDQINRGLGYTDLAARIAALEGGMAANDTIFDEQELQSRVEEVAARVTSLETTEQKDRVETPDDIQRKIVDSVRHYMENNLRSMIGDAGRDAITMALGKIDNVLEAKSKTLHNLVATQLDQIEKNQINIAAEYVASITQPPDQDVDSAQHDERARKETKS